jgi:hypothetical protein
LPYSLALLVAVGAPLSLALLGWGRKAYRAAMPAA